MQALKQPRRHDLGAFQAVNRRHAANVSVKIFGSIFVRLQDAR